MKPAEKLKCLVVLLFVTLSSQSLIAQNRADVFDKKVPITWLGIDYSQTKFIGVPDATTTNESFRLLYIPQWNQLFIDEQKKFNVAKATGRDVVKYAIDVTAKANKSLTEKDFFTNKPNEFRHLSDADIAGVVKNYDFEGNDGIGMLFIVEGMSKGADLEGFWVTFVDMKAKTVLYTIYKEEKPGGFGFRNYWAKPFYSVIKDMESDFKKWGKK